MKHACIIGLGRSGSASARLLQRQGWQVSLLDSSDRPELRSQAEPLVAAGIEVRLGTKLAPTDLGWSRGQRPDRLVVSPGVPWDLPGLVQARTLGCETLGEMELAWEALGKIPWVGITGTNGKTTVTTLIGAMLQRAGLDAPTCGNIGDAACGLAEAVVRGDRPEPEQVVAEISSYQIEAAPTLAPSVGVWTTFTPDHLARHYTLDNYFAIKASLLERSATKILNGDDPELRQRLATRWPDALWTSVQGPEPLANGALPAAWIDDEDWVIIRGERICPAGSLAMVGDHNRQNLLLAATASRLAGATAEAIAAAVADFPGVAHRLEKVGQRGAIAFINDSKATNYDAAEVGLRAVTGPTILIAGGEAKKGDDSAWMARIAEKTVAVLLIGKAADAFAARLQETGYAAPVENCLTLARAVPRALELARDLGAVNVLLSPACASFDQYPNFETRGDDFRHCVAVLEP